MAQLIVRDVDDTVAAALRRRAAANGRSAEAEHRDILREALLGAHDFHTILLSMPDVGDDSDFSRADDHGRELDLS